ncbi:hypothetical protein [Brucella pseudogrignonensis]|uniref:Phage terminase Nu1 subunit (DNA packaging protein) n=1 Tax=Brucella pseudogrignonensis TaxID=419475 RepID=A0ABU1M632_9HYPH|nr:hypothetical protein [Brucella pseudogrignonensis]MDR6431292.1 phage terminase Nu1 subunit (DNA packaging protein) [Brucella pseudogrignonensis]
MAKKATPKALTPAVLGLTGEELLSTSGASSLLGVTAQWLRQLSANGYVPTAVKGKYPLVAVVQGYIRSLKDEERRSTKSAADNGLKAARQREVELRIAKEEGRLVDMDDVEAVISSILATLRAELAGLPASVTRDVKLREEIEKGLNGAFARSQSKFQEASEALQSGGDPLGTDGEDDT